MKAEIKCFTANKIQKGFIKEVSMPKEIPCPKQGCHGTLEKCIISKTVKGTTHTFENKTVDGLGCDECKHWEEINPSNEKNND